MQVSKAQHGRLLAPTFAGERDVLVVNPETGMSKWVFLIRYPPDVDPRFVNAQSSQPTLPVGVAVPVESHPFSVIFFANESTAKAHLNTSGTSRASVSPVSAAEQMAINTAIQVTKKTYFVQLDPATFPSYSGSLQILIANQNFAALQNAGIGWPVTALSSTWWKALKKILGLYTGHSFVVCDIFGNGDSACFVPNPYDKNILEQDGPAKDADGNDLRDIANRVAGGGGDGPGITRTSPPPEILFNPPGGGGGIVCGLVDGRISTCIKRN